MKGITSSHPLEKGTGPARAAQRRGGKKHALGGAGGRGRDGDRRADERTEGQATVDRRTDQTGRPSVSALA